MTQQKKTTPATESSAYQRMKPRWNMAEALLGGTETMRAAGDTYLPQHPEESNSNYNARLARATLLNMTEMTLEALVGRPFSKPVVLGDDVPAQIAEMCEDVDLQGNNLQAFSRSWFRVGWAKGLGHVLVDFPVVERPDPSRPRTLADDRAENLRPFTVLIRPENVIAAYAETVNGRDKLTHVRIREVSVEQDGWGEVLVERIRVLEPGTWAVYRPNDKGDEWVLESEGVTPLDEIPLVTFYAGKREGLHECKPPLTDLMHLNVEHWQSASDQRNVLTVARFPILAGAGVSSGDQVTVGPNNYLTTEAPEGKWYYVEHTGAAIEAGEKDLERLKDQMSAYGAEFLRHKTGTETATARALDSAEGISYLQATALDFQDCLEMVIYYMGRWLRLDDAGSVKVYAGFASGDAAASDLEQLLKLRATKDISRKAILDEFQRRGVLSEDFDAEDDAKLREEEGEENPGMGDMFNNGQGTVTLGPDGRPLPPPSPDEEEEEEEEEAEA